MDTNTEKLQRLDALARDALKLSRNTLLVSLRFLDMALSMFELTPYAGEGIATDGARLYYDPVGVLVMFKDSQERLTRAYLHLVYHCVFRHMFVGSLVERRCWDLACDMAVEYAITGLELRSIAVTEEAEERACVEQLLSECRFATAERIYRYLLDAELPESELSRLEELFCYDDHTPWYAQESEGTQAQKSQQKSKQKSQQNGQQSDQQNDQQNGQQNGQQNDQQSDQQDDQQNSQQNDQQNGQQNSQQNDQQDGQQNSQQNDQQNGQQNGQQNDQQGDQQSASARASLEQSWKDISERMQQDLETFSKQRGDMAGGMMQNLREVNRERYDYTAFLKKFAVLTEVMKINDDEFDYIFYTYGLGLYKNLPLIEPLEYKDAKRIREFVIAIDTSGSVQGEKVQSFIQKTYNILQSTETFDSKINLHVIQCDAKVQEHVKLTSQEECERYIKSMTLRGFGGTDFRPVFSLVEKLREEKELTRLKGLIYFSDGYGTFPERKPDYDVAFVFVNDGYEIPEVPSWVIKLVLDKEEL